MKRGSCVVLLAVIVVGSFLTGSWFTQRTSARKDAPEGRRILYKEPTRYAGTSDKGPATPAGKRLSEAQWEGGTAKEKESAHGGHMHPTTPAPDKSSSQ